MLTFLTHNTNKLVDKPKDLSLAISATPISYGVNSVVGIGSSESILGATSILSTVSAEE